MNKETEVTNFQNGIFLSECPSKKFGLVEVKGVTHLARKDPELKFTRGNMVTVELGKGTEAKIV